MAYGGAVSSADVPAAGGDDDNDDEEQVVGVLKLCPVCGEKTVHVDGVCRDHKVIRRRKVGPPAATATATATATTSRPRAKQPPPKRKATSRLRYLVGGVLIAAVVGGAGFFHVVHGRDIRIHLCAKYGWSLADTVVDLDAYPPGPTRQATQVGVALNECQL